jgi:hypothetical protein
MTWHIFSKGVNEMWTLYDSRRRSASADIAQPVCKKAASGPDSGKPAESTLAGLCFLIEGAELTSRGRELHRKAA